MTTAVIVDGGIAGATTALALRKAGVDSVVYEAYSTGADDNSVEPASGSAAGPSAATAATC